MTQSTRGLLSAVQGVVSRRLALLVNQLWANPLLRHARRQKPMPLHRAGQGVGLAAIVFVLLSVAAWAASWRPLGAALMGLSLAGVLAPLLAAPVASADRVARQMRSSRHNPRLLTDLHPGDVAWGLSLVTLWRLRWPLALALALTPALVVGILRLDVADFTAWQSSAQVLGEATEAGRAPFLRPDGGIPYFRLVLHAITAALLPWAGLPALAALGVSAALLVRDVSLSPLAALLSAALLAALVLWVWGFFARTPLLAGSLEALRAILLLAVLGGLLGAAILMNRYNASLLADAPPGAGTPAPPPAGTPAPPGAGTPAPPPASE